MKQDLQKQDIVFVDTEVNPTKKIVEDIGAVRAVTPVASVNGTKFRSSNLYELEKFLKDATYVCGHNIINFDLKYIMPQVEQAGVRSIIDTLYLSALLFPQKPYHKLLKDDKLQADELNNPLNDAIKAMELFMDEVTAFEQLNDSMKKIYCTLLEMIPQFRGFFRYVNFHEKTSDLSKFIQQEFQNKICENANIDGIAKQYPVELAYCLAAISTGDRESIIPYWVQKNYPKVQNVYRRLRGIPCQKKCSYCREIFDIHRQLKKKFGFDEFRKYGGEPLQELAVQAAVDGKSVLAIFPTGGGKSITFQLPALMAAEATSGLTVVISPLQSLMKDQVDNLNRQGITDAVTINGLLNVVERAEALERIENGIASVLYISPESLRSKTIERLLLGRNIARFVIDEAHCFSSWGQDFRVDYLYIGDFIARLQEKKQTRIPVSCFTATAKQKVVSDIKEYFKQKLNIELELFSTNATRANLRYEVLYRANDTEKYATLRNLIEQKNCPTIVYVSRTKRTVEIAQKLYSDGFNAKAFHGKMEPEEKIANQEAFINGEVQIIVATSAFGMGVDKKDVKLVVHYDISDSLENYVQEAGRAGRDQNIQAECYVLFNEEDLDKHFILLNQTKLSISEIQQVWKGVKELTRERKRICCSALEIARKAGWDESVVDIETKVKTAISALETSGYLKRGQNCLRVYADSIQVKTAEEAITRINTSEKFNDKQKEYAVRIIKKLISTRSRSRADNGEAESRVDYIADHLGIEKKEVIEAINTMREEGILASDKEMSVFVETSSLRTNIRNTTLSKFLKLEKFLIHKLQEDGQRISYKVLNEEALEQGIRFSSVSNIKVLFFFWIIKGYINKPEGEISGTIPMVPAESVEKLKKRYEKRVQLAEFIENYFINKAKEKAEVSNQQNEAYITVNFSILDLKRAYLGTARQTDFQYDWQKVESGEEVTLQEIEEALLYLSKINAFRLEGGFLVIYNAMEITRLITDNKIRYKLEDYRNLKEFYNSKTQQIHIVGEYANMMVHDYQAALTFVNDYFQMEYKLFLTKYFKGARLREIDRNITPMKYQKLFENLSAKQSEIISDDVSKSIVVAAGPGSGKTKILVHKLASLMLLEDVKHEQLLMLTFSRAAAMEFKMRLVDLIGNAAYFVEIKTFHSYCFDLLGKIGNIENSQNVVRDATQMIQSGEASLDRITKNVLVLDEAQDMDEEEFDLVKALIERNEDMRVIAVGDDDQNIYEFRGSDSKYMVELLKIPSAKKYELIDNYRSSANVVSFANEFVKTLSNRIKSGEIHAVKEEPGSVMMVNVKSFLEMSLAKVVRQTWKKESNKTAAVLTTTNDQAYLVAELLNKNGFRARLIQSNEGFALPNLAEMRYFLAQLKNDSPVIPDEVWNQAWERLKRKFIRSQNLPACFEVLRQFEKVSSKKYYTDLESFLTEVRFEDFYSYSKDEICVSTIHKAKGMEFDTVYMLASGYSQLTDSQKRSIYVGITRAKSELYIFHNTKYFDSVRNGLQRSMEIKWYSDSTIYSEPEEIVLPLSHRDVWLGFFKAKNQFSLMEELQSGDMLQVRGEKFNGGNRLTFWANIQGQWQRVACCSKKYYETICKQNEKGYVPCEAKVQFVVSWWDKESEEEYYIVLPILRLKKRRL
ncbi:MAG: RecQ family ATP-dependent DNA helicase [Lachnospiraceae bacterium]|nr:RecQ family ATP-dependent DNA helicase [Lachnospiraceae bacterium]